MHYCSKIKTVEALAEFQQMYPQIGQDCSGQRSASDLITTDLCGFNVTSQSWRPGSKVSDFCDVTSNLYSAVATFKNGGYPSDGLAGVYVGCTATSVKLLLILKASSETYGSCNKTVRKLAMNFQSRWAVKKPTKRQRLLKLRDKENVSHKVPQDLDLVGRGLTVGEQTTLSTVQAVQERDPPPCSIGTQRDLFVQTAGTLKNEEKMTKCPMCQQAAIVYPVEERGVCQSDKCHFDYCVKCFHPFHQSRPCVQLTVSKVKRSKDSKIGGKRGKQNLRRL
eukprot:XP_019928855.1 PREDICTED: uncharacterized protein LOC105343175 [Crassostrea gigas]